MSNSSKLFAGCIKIDFSVDPDGRLIIFDVGAQTSGDDGFPEDLPRKICETLYELSNQLEIRTFLGEFELNIFNVMQNKKYKHNMEPILTATKASNPCILLSLLSHFTESGVSYSLRKQGLPIQSDPLGLCIIAYYKMIWYLLMQNFLHRKDFLFWGTNDPIDDLVKRIPHYLHGWIIKIINENYGCGVNVYYAANKGELTDILNRIACEHKKIRIQEERNDLYVIEPVFIHCTKSKPTYNAIGRAFIGMSYDGKCFKLKLVDAIWLYSKKELNKDLKQFDQEHIIINIAHCSSTQLMDDEEKKILLSKIISYEEIFKLCCSDQNLFLMFPATKGYIYNGENISTSYLAMIVEKQDSLPEGLDLKYLICDMFARKFCHALCPVSHAKIETLDNMLELLLGKEYNIIDSNFVLLKCLSFLSILKQANKVMIKQSFCKEYWFF